MCIGFYSIYSNAFYKTLQYAALELQVLLYDYKGGLFVVEKISFYVSLLLARLVYFFLKTTGISSGTSIIGRLVLKICPRFLSMCNKYIKTKINVTGTNGKTTTSGLVSHILKSSGATVINNAMGANMLTGVVNALALSVKPFITTDYSVIESDEAYLSKIYDRFDADYLIVTNLFRDQLDRYGELATTKKLIQDGINKKTNLNLLLNADDPLVASFEGSNKIFYGMENVYYADESLKTKSETEESFNCTCGRPLIYEDKFYAQQGHYYCSCGYKRPNPKYAADVTLYKDCSVLKINGVNYEIPLVGLFNAYNALAAISLCLELGVQNVEDCLKSFKVMFGRSEVKYLDGKKVLIQLIKNPIGANEVLKTVNKDSNLLIIINDNYADGRDVSWLWDAEFELLKDVQKEIVVSGIRANDMALRLKYAGIKNIKIINNIKKAVEYIGCSSDNSITILPTYTALLKLNKIKCLKYSDR